MTSATYKLNTIRLGRFAALVRYGPIFLDRQEYQARLNRVSKGYHAFLARSIFDLKGKAFWDFHRAELKNLGHPIRPLELVVASLRQLLNLRETVQRVRRAVKRRRKNVRGREELSNTALRTPYTR
jgi:hypothetical protein